jgi:hypothetical protein
MGKKDRKIILQNMKNLKTLEEYQDQISKKTEKKYLGTEYTGVNITYTSDKFKNQLLDTEVRVSDGVICWIGGIHIEEFHKALQELVDKYKI